MATLSNRDGHTINPATDDSLQEMIILLGGSGGGTYTGNVGLLNFAGIRINPATSENISDVETAINTVNTSVEAITTEIRLASGYVLSASYRITTGATATIPTLINPATLPANTVRIAIIPEDSSIIIRHAIGGAASGTSPAIPGGGVSIPVTQTVANTIQLFSASANYATLMVLVPGA